MGDKGLQEPFCPRLPADREGQQSCPKDKDSTEFKGEMRMSRGIPREGYSDHARADLALGADEKLAVFRPLSRREEIANNKGGKSLGSWELLPSPTATPMTTINYRKRNTGRKIRRHFPPYRIMGKPGAARRFDQRTCAGTGCRLRQ